MYTSWRKNQETGLDPFFLGGFGTSHVYEIEIKNKNTKVRTHVEKKNNNNNKK